MQPCEVLRFPSADALALHAAERWVQEVERAEQRGERHRVALSGGRIAANFFSACVAVARRRNTRFTHVQFFWADERCVPPDHPESNFNLAIRLLLEPLGIGASQVHRLKAEGDESAAVSAGVAALRSLAPLNSAGVPVLDLILLGMGEDGHVASLFPNSAESAAEATEVYLPVIATKPPPRRLTLGYAVLAAARAVWVLISGPGKEKALRDSLLPGGSTPLGRLLAMRFNTLVLSDIAGA